MRKSPLGFSGPLLIVALVCLFAFIFYQKALLVGIQLMLNSNRPVGLPTSVTPISGFSVPTAPAPVSVGREVIINNLGIIVRRVISPADSYLGKAAFPSVLKEGKEYLVVDVNVRCVSSKEKCHVTEFDFGVETKAGHDYPAELSGNYSDDLNGVFEGGDIDPEKSMSGSLIFILEKGENGLTLIYPRMFSFGGSAKFILSK
jgi:Domain of unknown function (DUF4352)